MQKRQGVSTANLPGSTLSSLKVEKGEKVDNIEHYSLDFEESDLLLILYQKHANLKRISCLNIKQYLVISQMKQDLVKNTTLQFPLSLEMLLTLDLATLITRLRLYRPETR